MKPKDPPPSEVNYVYAVPPQSGNEINGLGIGEKVRPTKIAPDDFMVESYEYKALWDFFFYTIPWSIFKTIMWAMFESRKARGPVAKTRVAVDDPHSMAVAIKQKAIDFGGGIVGITHALDDLLLYEDDEPHAYKRLEHQYQPACPPQEADPSRPWSGENLTRTPWKSGNRACPIRRVPIGSRWAS